MSKGYKRAIFASDSHCGHKVGLTPPEYFYHGKVGEVQATLWDFWVERIEKWKPFDIAIIDGDLVDGKGERSGGTELYTTDRLEQAHIAYECFKQIGADKYRIVAGTPYHSGVNEDFEKAVVLEFQKNGHDCGELQDHGYYEINGKNIDVKHYIANSSVHHGRATPVLKDLDANTFWNLADVEPKADIAIRAHVHKSLLAYQDERFGFVLPSLQGLGTKFGARRCSGVVEFGFLVIDIPDNPRDDIKWKFETMKGKQQRVAVEVL